jgi:hypothetical protein
MVGRMDRFHRAYFNIHTELSLLGVEEAGVGIYMLEHQQGWNGAVGIETSSHMVLGLCQNYAANCDSWLCLGNTVIIWSAFGQFEHPH